MPMTDLSVVRDSEMHDHAPDRHRAYINNASCTTAADRFLLYVAMHPLQLPLKMTLIAAGGAAATS